MSWPTAVYGPITPEQLARFDASAAELADRRRAAAYIPLLDRDEQAIHQADGTAVNCARCEHIGDFNAEHQRGWCMWRRRMVSSWHTAFCKAFKAG